MNTVMLLHRGGSTICGSEQCLIQTAFALRAVGMRLILVRNDPCLDEPMQTLVEEVVPFDYPELMLDGYKPRLPIARYARALTSLRVLAQRHRVSALIANGGLPCQLGVPVSRVSGIPLLCQFHHPANRRYLHLWLLKYAERRIYPSEFTRNAVLSRIGVDGDVVYNGVDTDKFAPSGEPDPSWRALLEIPAEAVVFGQVGALVPHKRQRLLLTAFAKSLGDHPLAYLALVGSGPDLIGLKTLADELGIAHKVRFTGYVESTVPFFQHVIDVNVLASAEEGLGISVLEGSAVALPALIANATGLRETIIAEQTGLCFEADDVVGLGAGLVRLANDAALRQALGVQGREHVRQNFSLSRYRERIAAIVSESISRNIA